MATPSKAVKLVETPNSTNKDVEEDEDDREVVAQSTNPGSGKKRGKKRRAPKGETS